MGEHQLDKLGVTGSSPVPPTYEASANAEVSSSQETTQPGAWPQNGRSESRFGAQPPQPTKRKRSQIRSPTPASHTPSVAKRIAANAGHSHHGDGDCGTPPRRSHSSSLCVASACASSLGTPSPSIAVARSLSKSFHSNSRSAQPDSSRRKRLANRWSSAKSISIHPTDVLTSRFIRAGV